MGKVYRQQRIEGVTIPAIIHNRDYFWDNMAVYEDGTISCWERTDLGDVPRQISRGWLTPTVPEGKWLSVFQCCVMKIRTAKWNFDNASYYKFIKDTVRSINPEMANIFKMTDREKSFWKERRICLSADPVFCKTNPNAFGYSLLEGNDAHLFLRRDGKIQLTDIYSYEDGTFLVDALGEKYFTLSDIEKMFAEKTLCVAPEAGETVSLGALGEVECENVCAEIDNDGKLSEIRNKSLDAQGKPDAHKLCMDAYVAYLIEPSDYCKEKLREAYEAVPEHERCYLGDMDTRDSDFIRILYTDEKREV